MKAKGSTTILLRGERSLGSAMAPCQGYYRFVEEGVPDTVKDAAARRINCPSMFDLVKTALGDVPEFDSIIKVAVTVEVVKNAKPRRKRCLNPWPAHVCDDGKIRKPENR